MGKKVVQKETKNTKSKATKVMVIVAISIVLAVGVGLGLFFVLRDKKKNPVVNAVIPEKTYYAGFTLATVDISLGNGSTDGTIQWVNENEVLLVGTHTYKYKFTPENTDNFYCKTGDVKITATAATLSSLEVKTAPNKISGYKAYDEFDVSGLVLEASFADGGKQVFASGYEVVYQQNGATTVLAGDTKVVIKFNDATCEIAIDAVEKLKIEEPSIDGIYVFNGEEQIAQIPTSKYYTVTNNKQTNAGDYGVSVSLVDPSNTEWVNDDSASIVLDWNIAEAAPEVEIVSYNAVYDAAAHEVYVLSDDAQEIYYAEVELDESNYLLDGSQARISRTNVSNNPVYYYVVGKTNYANKSGEIEFVIEKTTARVGFKETSFLTIATANPQTISESSVDVFGVNDVVVDVTSKIDIVYYKDSQATTKTTTADGALVDGGVPQNVGRYYVKVTFIGNDTYVEGTSEAVLYLVENPNTDLISTSLPSFDFRRNNDTEYFQFKIDETNGPAKFTFTSNVFDATVITKEAGFYTFVNDGQVYRIQLAANKNTLEITNTQTGDVTTFDKWIAPDFLGVYSCYTKGTSKDPSILNIYLEDGQFKFILDYNTGSSMGQKVGYVEQDEDLLTFYYGGTTFLASWFIDDDELDVYFTQAEGIYTRVS